MISMKTDRFNNFAKKKNQEIFVDPKVKNG